MDNEELYQKASNIIMEDVDNIISDDNNHEELSYQQLVNVHVKKTKDIAVIDVKNLEKINYLCEEAKKVKFPLAELFLGLASLFWGAVLGAIISQVPYEYTALSIFSYSICPAFGIGFGIAFWHYRKNNEFRIHDLAKNISEYISESLEEVNNNEY